MKKFLKYMFIGSFGLIAVAVVIGIIFPKKKVPEAVTTQNTESTVTTESESEMEKK